MRKEQDHRKQAFLAIEQVSPTENRKKIWQSLFITDESGIF